ncbi:MAG: nucleotide exchange factor GrpE [Candidatus Izemoplasma sp.]
MTKKKTVEEQVKPLNEEEVEQVLVEDDVVEETKEEKLEKEVINLKDKFLRNQAELENFKKRLNEERIRERKYSSMDVCKALLAPLDHFDLALKQEVKDEVSKNFLKGFKMIEDQLYNTLKDQGAVEVDALNKEYDPNYHQAITTEKVEGVKPGIVTEVLQKGYMFKDRLLRPSIVKISE